MHRFKVGQEVVAVKRNIVSNIKIGDEFTVEGLTCCPGCGDAEIFLKGKTKIYDVTSCSPNGCNQHSYNVRESYAESAFAPKQSLSEAIEYRLTVSIPELTEIKTPQLQ